MFSLTQTSVQPKPKVVITLMLSVIAIFSLTTVARAQQREHLTEPEMELVRNNQALDKRIDVFIKAADRRLALIQGTVQPPPPKKSGKNEEDWGDLPKGRKAELLSDIAGILDEAITNIDDVSRRDEKNPLISRSLRKLTGAANNYVTQLTPLRDRTTDDDELAAIARVLNEAAQIIEAGGNLPAAPVEDQKKKKP